MGHEDGEPDKHRRDGYSEDSRQLDSPALGQLFDDLLPMARRTRNRADSIARRFVNRTQSGRPQPFLERWRLLIHGRVQGVGFRASCNRRALDLGLRAGSATCATAELKCRPKAASGDFQLRAWCEQGPWSRGAEVQLSQLPVTGDDWFEVRR